MMRLLHRINPVKTNDNFNTIEEIVACRDVLSFDGVYTDVYQHFDQLRGKQVHLFVTGAYTGRDNSFDIGQPHAVFCTWEQIMAMGSMGATIGWHTWHHKDLTTLTDAELYIEVRPPLPMPFFAYPYGKYDARVIAAVQAAGFAAAYTVGMGEPGNRFAIGREYL